MASSRNSVSDPSILPWRKVSISADLLADTPVYLNYLHRWSQLANLDNELIIRRIIYRYENFWLPLHSGWGKSTDIQPPTDIHWLWHLHVLLPNHYAQYCQNRFGKLLNFQLRCEVDDLLQATERTKVIWKERFPLEPYQLDFSEAPAASHVSNGTKLGHLVGIASQAVNFFHQVSLPHYRDQSFLFRAMDRYKQFLYFKMVHPEAQIEIPLDIQLIWRAHCLRPSDYHREIQNRIPRESPLLSARSDGRFEMGRQSSELWYAVFKEHLYINGTAFRGNTTSGIIEKATQEDIPKADINTCEISFGEISISDIPGWGKGKSITVEARRIGERSIEYKPIFKVKGKVDEPMRNDSSVYGLGAVDFDSVHHRGIEFHVLGKKGRGCVSKEVRLNTVRFNPRELFNHQSFHSRDFQYEVPKASYTDPRLIFACKVKACEAQPRVLSMDRNPFSAGPLPDQLAHLVVDLPQWRQVLAGHILGAEQDMDFQLARHGLKSRQGDFAFGCQVIKHEENDLAGVLLYHNNDRLVAAAHSIADDNLAMHEQLTTSCPLYLDVQAGERAMLVRNAGGDWAVCVARWQAQNLSTGEGRVCVRLYFVRTGKSLEFDIRDDELHTIKFDRVQIDMPTGRITTGDCQEIPEYVALAMSVGMLFVTCQKHVALAFPTGSVRSVKSAVSDSTESLSSKGQKAPSRHTVKGRRRRKLTRRRKMSASFTFLLACGLQIEVALYGESSVPSSRASTLSGLPIQSNQQQLAQQSLDAIFEADKKKSMSSKPTKENGSVHGFIYKRNGHTPAPLKPAAFDKDGVGHATLYQDKHAGSTDWRKNPASPDSPVESTYYIYNPAMPNAGNSSPRANGSKTTPASSISRKSRPAPPVPAHAQVTPQNNPSAHATRSSAVEDHENYMDIRL